LLRFASAGGWSGQRIVEKTNPEGWQAAIVLAEARAQPVCPPDIDISIYSDPDHGWRADTISPNHIGNADCAHHIGTIVQRLRREYDLKGD
jgi:hypothetical protein